MKTDSRVWIALAWGLASAAGVVAGETVFGGVPGVLLSVPCLFLMGVFFYAAGLYTAGWEPGQRPPRDDVTPS